MESDANGESELVDDCALVNVRSTLVKIDGQKRLENNNDWRATTMECEEEESIAMVTKLVGDGEWRGDNQNNYQILQLKP